MKSTRYKESIIFLFQQLPMYQRIGPAAFKKDLGNTIKLLRAIGNPEKSLSCIHIAGTNGKGSTAHILSSIYQNQGFKVGLYTSPHYKDFRERIKINGNCLSRSFVIDFVDRVKVLANEIKPSFFEISVAMAFDYFNKEQVDLAIIETGLGGRLDSTNVIDPLLSVITNISYDHTEMLGDTLSEIATEKAGIIKRNKPVLIGKRQEEIMSVFMDKAEKEQADLYFAKDWLNITRNHAGYKQSYSVSDPFGSYKIETDLSGDYQLENLQTAISTVHVLNKYYPEFGITKKHVIDGLKQIAKDTYFLGRWQKLSSKPLIIAESAHNLAGITHLTQKLSSLRYSRLHIILGFVNDKKLDQILNCFPKIARYYFVAAKVPRAKSADALCAQAAPFGLVGKAYMSVKKGLAAARMSANDEDVVVITGSIFVVAEVL